MPGSVSPAAPVHRVMNDHDGIAGGQSRPQHRRQVLQTADKAPSPISLESNQHKLGYTMGINKRLQRVP